MDVRKFTYNDYCGYAGACKFDDGSEPVIGVINITGWGDNGEECELVFSKTDIEDEHMIGIMGDNDGCLTKNVCSKAEGMMFIKGLPSTISFEDLLDLGFEVVN